MDDIYIFGHKNPDTDSICSAIAYAHLKNLEAEEYIPARLGKLNKETKFVLDTFAVPEPMYLPHVYTRVQDVMTTKKGIWITCASIQFLYFAFGWLQ